jgi:hypothetical protein
VFGTFRLILGAAVASHHVGVRPWRAYADAAWFVTYESRCEATLPESAADSSSALDGQNAAV